MGSVRGAAAPAVGISRTADLYVAPSAIHGLGVFAARSMAAGDLVECCPAIVCPAGDEALLEATALRGLYFTWQKGAVAVALGFGSLYNHSWRANARYELGYRARLVRVLAVRAIAEGEEVTINYTGHPDGRGELWFDAPEHPGEP